MNVYFVIAAALIFGIGLTHSWLGERYILIRLFRRQNLPHLFGSDLFTKRTLRFAWHITTLAWSGLAASLLALASSPLNAPMLLLSQIIAATFFVSSVVSLFGSRGRHYSWIVFMLIAALVFFGGR